MFKLEFHTYNAAFESDDAREEVGRILNVIAEQVIDGEGEGKIRDVNGNTVGRWSMSLNEQNV